MTVVFKNVEDAVNAMKEYKGKLLDNFMSRTAKRTAKRTAIRYPSQYRNQSRKPGRRQAVSISPEILGAELEQ